MSENKVEEGIKCPDCDERFKSRRSIGLHRSKKHGYKRVKHKSRADRASEQASQWEDIASQLRSLLDESIEDNEGNENEGLKASIVSQAQGIIDGIDSSELESLTEEITNWRDGMQGTNLENSNKYSELEEAASTLEGIDVNSFSIDDYEDIENVAEELESAASELQGVEFPRMF